MTTTLSETDIPGRIVTFFKGSGGMNILASPKFLRANNYSNRVDLKTHEIYHGGKDKSGKTVYTKFMILSKESSHNTIQGILEVKLISGYGIKDGMTPNESQFLRPNDIKKLLTEGTTSIKRNSVIILQNGIVVRLEDVENFCDLPIIPKKLLIESQTADAISKREIYKINKGSDNWAHVKRNSLVRDMERSIHKMLLPYYRKFRGEKDKNYFFNAFMEDILSTCNAHHGNFIDNGDFNDVLSNCSSSVKRKSPNLSTETRPRKKWGGVKIETKEEGVVVKDLDIVKVAIKNVSKAKIDSLIF